MRPFLHVAAFLLVISGARIAVAEEPGKDADRAAKFAERNRLWTEAQKLRDQGKIAEAIGDARKIIAIEQELLGKDHAELISIWSFIAGLAEGADDWTNAGEARAEAWRMATVAYGKSDWRTTDARLAQEHMAHLRGRSAADRQALREASVDNSKVERLYSAAKYDEAVKLAIGVTETRERLLGPEHPQTALSLHILAQLYYAQANYAAAEPLYQRALAIWEKALGPEHPVTAHGLNNLAELYATQGNYAAAEPLHQRALKIREEALGPEHPDTAMSLSNLAELYATQGNYAAAEPLHQRALKIREEALGPEHPLTALDLSSLSRMYTSQGNYAAAEPLYQRALAIWEKALGSEHPDTALGLNNLAQLHYAQANYAAAEPLYQRALAIWEKALGSEHPQTALGLNNLAALYYAQANYAAAEPLYQRALAISQKALRPEHPQTALGLNNLAGLYVAQGNYAAAEPLHQRALKIREEALGPEHPDTAVSLNNLAFLYWQSGRAAAARDLASRSLDVQIRHLERTAAIQTEEQQLIMERNVANHFHTWLTVTSGDRDKAGDTWQYVLAWKGLTTNRQLGLRQALKDDAGFADYRRVGQQLSTLTLNPPRPPSDPAALAAWNARAPELRREWRRRKESLEAQWERLEKALSQRSAAFAKDREASRATPASLQAALIAWHEARRPGREASQPGATSAQGASARPPRGALVDIVQYWYCGRAGEISEWRIAAFVVRGDCAIDRIELGASEPVQQQIAAWRQSFGRSDGASDPGAELRRALWEPIAAHLKDIDTVLISPDGVLAQLPWGALPGEKPDTFLIEERALAVIATPQLLPELLAREPPGGPPPSLLVAGDIDYGADAGAPQDLLAQRAAGRARDGKLLGFDPLDSAQAELASIERRYRKKVPDGESDALEGAEATEAAFRDQAGRHAWLHVITHGFFAPETIKSALETARAASPALGFGDLNSRPRPVGVHPGLLSGLAFAGANSPPQEGKDDGILTALEVSALDLSQVDTVVLSACETGLGEVAGGEGLFGLQRAFQVAGAKTVVASLWKIPDGATSDLMQRFYENLWDKKMGKLAALREAQLWMLREVPKDPKLRSAATRGLNLPDDEPETSTTEMPPFFWAAFVLSGDWR